MNYKKQKLSKIMRSQMVMTATTWFVTVRAKVAVGR